MPPDPRNIGWQQGRRHSSQTKSLGEEVKTPSVLWTRKGRRMKRRSKGEREEEETERRKKGGGDLSSDSRTVLSPATPLQPSLSALTQILRAGSVWLFPSIHQGPAVAIEEKGHSHLHFSVTCAKFCFVAEVFLEMTFTILLSVIACFSQSTPKKIGMLISHRETLCLPCLTAVSSVEKLVSGEGGREGALALAIS